MKVFLEGPDGQPVASRELPAGLLDALLPPAPPFMPAPRPAIDDLGAAC
ncbi:MAG: hypothetical protein R3F29_00020 [Planctomycetota bacterium]